MWGGVASIAGEREHLDGFRVLRRTGQHHDSAEIARGRAAAPNYREGGWRERWGIVLRGHDFDTSDGGTPSLTRRQYLELEDGGAGCCAWGSFEISDDEQSWTI